MSFETFAEAYKRISALDDDEIREHFTELTKLDAPPCTPSTRPTLISYCAKLEQSPSDKSDVNDCRRELCSGPGIDVYSLYLVTRPVLLISVYPDSAACSHQ